MVIKKKILVFLFLSALLIIPSSYQIRRLDYRDARMKNVCKDLRGNVLLYFIFIDTRTTAPWTEFDIQTTIDSVRTAINWLHSEAEKNQIPLNITADFYIGNDYTTIAKNLPGKSVLASVSEPSYRKAKESINRWADGIARTVGRSFTLRSKEGIPDLKSPNNKERLVAFLRDKNNVESVALMYFVNNYYKKDISVPVNIFDTEDVEFAIVSYKYAAEIAHNFLNLYGAADMHETIYRRNVRKIKELHRIFPRDIMQNPYGVSIREMEMGEYTKYLIGWTEDLDPSLEEMMTDKLMNY